MRVLKAVIPAAGLGTRMLPATKSIPKEMLPVAGKPVIQYVVEEAIEAGIEEILIVISKGKEVIQDHFSRDFANRHFYEQKSKYQEIQALESIGGNKAEIHFIYQNELKGLGDAVLLGRDFTGHDPFAVLLGDSIITGARGSDLTALIGGYEKYGTSVLGVEVVERHLVHRYGIIDATEVDGDRMMRLKGIVEKPDEDTAASNMAATGRYVFTPRIYNFLEESGKGVNNEIQLTDAMAELVKTEGIYAYQIDGTRFDIGNKSDFIMANLILGQEDSEMLSRALEWFRSQDE